MDEDVHEYTGTEADVTWDAERCIHYRACVKGAPEVFDTSRRPWVLPDGTDDVDHLARVVESCPTGALHYDRHDGETEGVPETNTVDVAAGGPLYVRGDVTVEDGDGEVLLTDTRLALCRCGGSGNKPLCDGTHGDVGFDAAGTVPADGSEDSGDWTGGGGLTVVPTADGPILLRGEFELRGQADGSASDERGGAMCRCGSSGRKPFCDGTHATVGFESDD